MANKIILKKSSVPSKIPLSVDLDPAELGINLADKVLYSKDTGNDVFIVRADPLYNTGLQDKLDAKVNVAGDTMTGDLEVQGNVSINNELSIGELEDYVSLSFDETSDKFMFSHGIDVDGEIIIGDTEDYVSLSFDETSDKFMFSHGIDVDGNTTIQGTVTTNQYILSDLNGAPAGATANGVKGEIRVTADFIYVCIETNTWVRAALSTW